MTASLQEKVDTLETRTDSLETILGQFISSVNKAVDLPVAVRIHKHLIFKCVAAAIYFSLYMMAVPVAF